MKPFYQSLLTRAPRKGDFWWGGYLSYNIPDIFAEKAVYTEGNSFAPDPYNTHVDLKGVPCEIFQVAPPLALPGQFLIHNGNSTRVGKVRLDRSDREIQYTWTYISKIALRAARGAAASAVEQVEIFDMLQDLGATILGMADMGGMSVSGEAVVTPGNEKGE